MADRGLPHSLTHTDLTPPSWLPAHPRHIPPGTRAPAHASLCREHFSKEGKGSILFFPQHITQRQPLHFCQGFKLADLMISLIFFPSSFLCRSLLSVPVGWKQRAREPCKELHATKQHPLASLHLPLPSPPAPCGPEGVFHQRTWLKGQDVLQQSARWYIHTGRGTWHGATWQCWRGGAQPWVHGWQHGTAQG